MSSKFKIEYYHKLPQSTSPYLQLLEAKKKIFGYKYEIVNLHHKHITNPPCKPPLHNPRINIPKRNHMKRKNQNRRNRIVVKRDRKLNKRRIDCINRYFLTRITINFKHSRKRESVKPLNLYSQLKVHMISQSILKTSWKTTGIC